VFHAIPDLASPPQVQASLREILADPELRVYWWDWERECYVNVDATPEEPRGGTDRTVTLLAYETRKIGAIVHDDRLLEAPEFLDSFIPMMRIAMERDRLHRDLTAKLEQLQASRLRIVRSADEERRRLERNLHDGAQQRLIATLLPLRTLSSRVADDEELAPLAQQACEELEGAIEDLRELARGLHPPLLARRGLAAALRAGATRSSLPVELEIRLGDDLSPAVEAAAYYVCAEAVTNATKHARASRVWIAVAQDERSLTVEVRDDGVGGARFDGADATGLEGLRDRVEALDGRLELESPPACGTRLVARFPVAAYD